MVCSMGSNIRSTRTLCLGMIDTTTGQFEDVSIIHSSSAGAYGPVMSVIMRSLLVITFVLAVSADTDKAYTCRCGAAIVNPVLGSSATQQMDNFIANRAVTESSCSVAEATCYNYCRSEGARLELTGAGNGSKVDLRGIARKSISAGWPLYGGFPTGSSSTLGDVMCSLYNLPLDRSLGASLELKGDVAECPRTLKGIFVLAQNFCCAFNGAYLIGMNRQTNC